MRRVIKFNDEKQKKDFKSDIEIKNIKKSSK
jgi:hypothetical protein